MTPNHCKPSATLAKIRAYLHLTYLLITLYRQQHNPSDFWSSSKVYRKSDIFFEFQQQIRFEPGYKEDKGLSLKGKVMEIIRHEGNGIAPLYVHYERQSEPQGAYIEIDPEQQTISANYNCEIGTMVPAEVYYDRVFRLPISPCISAEALSETMEAILPHANRIANGYECKREKGKVTGHLTEDAQFALNEARAICEDLADSELDQVWAAEDWLADWSTELTGRETDEELSRLADKIQDDASSDRARVRDLLSHLESLRDEAKEKGE